jgi:hypothetical protein
MIVSTAPPLVGPFGVSRLVSIGESKLNTLDAVAGIASNTMERLGVAAPEGVMHMALVEVVHDAV